MAKKNTSEAPTKKKKNKKKMSKAGKVFTAILTVFLMLFLIGLVTGGSIMLTVLADIGLISIGDLDHSRDIAGIDYIDLDNYINSQAKTTIIYAYDADGNLVEEARLHGTENRTPTALKDVSQYVKDAVVSLEDKRFYEHKGVDWIRTFGVIIKDITSSGDVQGGSTITQQLIKNLTGENKKTLIRKYNEIKNALALERHFTKEEILEAYLNTIYLDNGCYGIKTGAEYYFGKNTRELTLMESAMLVSITNAPRKYDPIYNYDNNRDRAIMCLNYMLEQGKISQEEYDEALEEDVQLIGKLDPSATGEEDEVTFREISATTSEYQSYYTDYIITATMRALMEKFGYSSDEAWRKVYLGGLKIISAVDINIQKQMEYVYVNRVGLPSEEDDEKGLQSAMVIMDYEGRVLGMVGQMGEKKGNRVMNYAVSDPRQPGSSIKPLSVYTPAIDTGKFFWSSYLPNYGISLPGMSSAWPTNFEGVRGSMTDLRNLAEAIAPSLNTIPARLVQALSTYTCYSYLRDVFHMSTLEESDQAYAPLAIGAMTRGVVALDMAAAYATFGNGGYYYEPWVYYEVRDANDNVILEGPTEGEQVISSATADVMNHLLQTVVTSSNGTGRPYAVTNFTMFAKTGTTSDYVDKWMAGGTPYYVAAVWAGFKDRTPINTRVYGSQPAGVIFKEVMNRVHEGLPSKSFEYSGNAVRRTFCKKSGMLAGSRCASTSSGWFRIDALPGICTSCDGSEEDTTDEEEVTTKRNEESTTKKTPEPTTVRPVEPTTAQQPVTQPPVTQPPVTQPPVTQPPVTQPPVTQPPVTQPEPSGDTPEDGG
ncbi:MAG: transglycosylase domain-containing protein [Clostridia bacterium]|nr:transglycosylase domain-containing protein [Clostridia bacterium]